MYLKVVDEAGNKTVYEYDPEDTRVAVIQNGIRTEYVVDKNTVYSQILTETTYEQGALGIKKKTAEKDYIYGLGLICEADKETEECNYYHYNNLGSTTELTDKAGNVLYRLAYGPYGELTGIRDGNGNNLIHLTVGKNVKECLCETLSKIKVPFLYNGQYGVLTDQNGLYYMRARYYNTDIKRFINRDILSGDITNSQSLNQYCYVQGNPITLTDPFGLCPNNNNNSTSAAPPPGSGNGNQNNPKESGIMKFLKGLIPGYGAVYLTKQARASWKEGDYFGAVGNIIGAIGNVAMTAGLIASAGVAIGLGATVGVKAAAAVSTVTSVAAMGGATALSGYSFGNGISDAIDEKIETGKVSFETTCDLLTRAGETLLAVGLGIKGVQAIEAAPEATALTLEENAEMRASSAESATTSEINARSAAENFGACFIAGTKVLTIDGEKNIEEISVGDYVLSYNPETGEKEYKEVLDTFINEKDVLVHLNISEEEVVTTLEHPFYVEDEGFVTAGKLQVGDVVRLADDSESVVSAIRYENLKKPVRVYNFEVEDFHTYYVSGVGVLVHNMCAERVSKNVPNPNGKKGGTAHQNTINSIENTNANGKIQYERKYDTPNGYKQRRYADAVEIVDGEVTKIHQVGKVNKNGTPIMRESKAIDDIMNSSDYNGAPVYFWSYNNPQMGPIIFEY